MDDVRGDVLRPPHGTNPAFYFIYLFFFFLFYFIFFFILFYFILFFFWYVALWFSLRGILLQLFDLVSPILKFGSEVYFYI